MESLLAESFVWSTGVGEAREVDSIDLSVAVDTETGTTETDVLTLSSATLWMLVPGELEPEESDAEESRTEELDAEEPGEDKVVSETGVEVGMVDPGVEETTPSSCLTSKFWPVLNTLYAFRPPHASEAYPAHGTLHSKSSTNEPREGYVSAQKQSL